MAADWIKMRGELMTHPKFLSLCSSLLSGEGREGLLEYACGSTRNGRNECHESCVTIRDIALNDVTLCALLKVWMGVNSHCKVSGTDAIMQPMRVHDIDNVTGIRGFGEAMVSVGWVRVHDRNSLLFPNFLEFNEPASLRRKPLTSAERQRLFRSRKAAESDMSRNVTDVTKCNDRRDETRVLNTEDVPSSCSEVLHSQNSEPERARPTESETKKSRRKTADDDDSPILLTFPCRGEPKTWHFREKYLAELTEAYTGIDILAECRKAIVWVRAAGPKTAGKMKRFLVNWMGRAVDSPRRSRATSASEAVPAKSSRPSLRDLCAGLNLPDSPKESK